MSANDEYKFDEDESPTCFVQVSLAAPSDRQRFLTIVSNLAARLNLFQRPSPILADGRPLPGIYVSEEFRLIPSVFDSLPDPAMNYAQVRLELCRRSFPHAKFKDIATEFIAEIRSAFGAQVRLAGTDLR